MADEVINPLGSPTTNYSWTKPTVGADVDVWGGMLNTDLDSIDSTVKSVSNVANAAYPASNPSGYQTAAQVTAAVPVASSTTPLMDGAAAIGTGTTWARADHVHPVDTSRYAASNPSGYQTAAQVTASLGNYLPLAGGTVSGGLIVSGGTSCAGTLSANSGVFNLSVASGGTNPTIQLLNAAQTVVGGWMGNVSTGAVTLNSVSSGSVLTLLGDISAAPGAGHNFIVSPGQGYQAGGGSWGALSDARIKTVDGEYELGLDEVLALRPVVYRYNGNDSFTEGEPSMHAYAAEQGQQFVGLVAQEVEVIFPDMVSQREGWIDGVKVNDLRNLNASELIYALVNAVKTLAARVAELEAVRG